MYELEENEKISEKMLGPEIMWFRFVLFTLNPKWIFCVMPVVIHWKKIEKRPIPGKTEV